MLFSVIELFTFPFLLIPSLILPLLCFWFHQYIFLGFISSYPFLYIVLFLFCPFCYSFLFCYSISIVFYLFSLFLLILIFFLLVDLCVFTISLFSYFDIDFSFFFFGLFSYCSIFSTVFAFFVMTFDFLPTCFLFNTVRLLRLISWLLVLLLPVHLFCSSHK